MSGNNNNNIINNNKLCQERSSAMIDLTGSLLALIIAFCGTAAKQTAPSY
jgi:hypothetical protein